MWITIYSHQMCHLSCNIRTTEINWFELNMWQSYRFKRNKLALNRSGLCVESIIQLTIPLQNQNWTAISHIASKAENSNIRWNFWEVPRKEIPFLPLLKSMSTKLNQVDDDSLLLSDSKSKVYFNAIDKAHEILEDDRDLAQKVPSCVVVGMQSVGKSAVLSRISGIRFPQDSEVCTRVAIELRLRRSREKIK